MLFENTNADNQSVSPGLRNIHQLAKGAKGLQVSFHSLSFIAMWPWWSVSLSGEIEQQEVGSSEAPCCGEPPLDCGTCWNLGGRVVRLLQQ